MVQKRQLLEGLPISCSVKGREFWPSSEEGPLLSLMVRRMPRKPTTKKRKETMEVKNKGSTKLLKHVAYSNVVFVSMKATTN